MAQDNIFQIAMRLAQLRLAWIIHGIAGDEQDIAGMPAIALETTAVCAKL